MAAILYPHPLYFLSAVPSIHPKNHAPCDNPTSPQHRHPCQIALAARQHRFGRLDLNVSSPYLDTPVSALPTFPSHPTHPVIRHTHLYVVIPAVAIRSSVLQLISSAARRTPQSVPLGHRGCTDAADKIKMSLVLPHQAIFTSAETDRVNISATTSDVGTLANHVPSIEPLRPGVVEVIESGNALENWVVSGGFVTVHPNNKLTINALLPASSMTPHSFQSQQGRLVSRSSSPSPRIIIVHAISRIPFALFQITSPSPSIRRT